MPTLRAAKFCDEAGRGDNAQGLVTFAVNHESYHGGNEDRASLLVVMMKENDACDWIWGRWHAPDAAEDRDNWLEILNLHTKHQYDEDEDDHDY